MYFAFIKSCILLLMTILCVQGVYSLATNNKFKDCAVFEGCAPVFAVKISLINKGQQDSYMNAEAWLDLAVVLLMIVVFHFHRRTMRRIVFEVDAATLSPPDFTLKVRRVNPTIEDDNQLKNFFEEVIPNRKKPVTVTRIIRAYDIGKEITDIRKVERLAEKKKVAKTEAEKTAIQKQIDVIEHRLKKADEIGVDLAPVAFVSFETEQDSKDVMEYLMGSGFKRLMGSLLNYPKHLYPEQLGGNFMPVCEAPEPTDVIWENLAYTAKDKLKRRFQTFFLTVLLVCACFGALLGISIAQV